MFTNKELRHKNQNLFQIHGIRTIKTGLIATQCKHTDALNSMTGTSDATMLVCHLQITLQIGFLKKGRLKFNV